MPDKSLTRASLALAVCATMLVGDLAVARTPVPEAFVLGRDANGEPCQISRNWRDDRLSNPFDKAWAITCRGVTAARAQGWLLAVRGGKMLPDDGCGAPSTVRVEGVGAVVARACFDSRLALPVVRFGFDRGGTRYTGAALATALGPLESAMRAIAGAAPVPAADVSVKPSIDPAKLAPAPAPARARAAGNDVDPSALLQAGIALNHRGQYIEASRLLNDVLSRLAASTPPLIRAELELEAGLADSNIGQFDAAKDHFDRGNTLIAAQPGVDRAAYLQSKQATYRGQDAINRRQFAAALALLGNADAAGDPLSDPAILSALNQPAPASGVRAALSSADIAQLSGLLLEAQRSWARSVASLSLNNVAAARRALDEGLVAVDQLQRAVPPESVSALKARVQRQYGRLSARDGKLPQAVHAFDCALATLQNLPVAGGAACPLDLPRRGRPGAATIASGVAGAGNGGPMVAETELERASLLARLPGVDRARVLSDFANATDTLIASGASGNVVPAAMEVYLDLLAATDARAPSSENGERFFRALQSVGEPTVARQIAQLQRIVTADGPTAAKVRDRAELERSVIRLRYEIASAPAERLEALEADRLATEAKLAAVDAELAGDPRFRNTDDAPVKISELQTALRADEAYLKIVQLRNRAFGIMVDAKRAYIYALAAPASTVGAIAARVRASIRDDSGLLPFFDVPAAYALFDLIAGPARPALLAAKSLVIDPSGPLANLPAGVLVTDLESVRRHAITRKTAPNDLTQVRFLAGHADITGALSPRSFLIARALAPSRAPDAFIGFGENATSTALGAQATMRVQFGSGCDVSYAELAEIMNANKPVSSAEIRMAATSLGVPAARAVTGLAFSDRAVMAESAKGDLARYQVLHFATHGLPETKAGCLRVPPSLVTTLAPPDGGAAPSDGLLSFSEIAALRLDANLVVLSACETASGVSGVGGRLGGQDESGATLDGLVRAFITANARAVLATYWKVPAIASSDEFIRAFYARGRTASIGAALRDAQLGAMKVPATSHPYYWGAYFLVGDASKSMLSPATPAAAQIAAR
jgi:tetratricopeptide (TPR) repeat protein